MNFGIQPRPEPSGPDRRLRGREDTCPHPGPGHHRRSLLAAMLRGIRPDEPDPARPTDPNAPIGTGRAAVAPAVAPAAPRQRPGSGITIPDFPLPGGGGQPGESPTMCRSFRSRGGSTSTRSAPRGSRPESTVAASSSGSAGGAASSRAASSTPSRRAGGTGVTITIREGADGLDVACIEIAMLKATIVDLR